MAARVNFVDTTIFCNILPVPGRDQDRDQVRDELSRKMAGRETMILPVTTVIETGNFIAQISDGRLRRSAAERFGGILELVIRGEAPWQLHQFAWDAELLRELVDGAGTGVTLVDHAMAELGCGDLCILAERRLYQSRTGLSDVQVWTMDHGLANRC